MAYAERGARAYPGAPPESMTVWRGTGRSGAKIPVDAGGAPLYNEGDK